MKKIFKNFFSGDLHLRKPKKGLCKFSASYLAFSNKISRVQKIVLSTSQGQGNFRGLEVSRPRPRTSKCVLEDSTPVVSTKGCNHPNKKNKGHKILIKIEWHVRNVKTIIKKYVFLTHIYCTVNNVR